MGGLFGIWNWMKGNKKCPNCGSYDTEVKKEELAHQRQVWMSDYNYPRNSNFVRPQSVFNEVYITMYCKCNDCYNDFIDCDVKTQRA